MYFRLLDYPLYTSTAGLCTGTHISNCTCFLYNEIFLFCWLDFNTILHDSEMDT